MVDILREVSKGMEGESYRTDGILRRRITWECMEIRIKAIVCLVILKAYIAPPTAQGHLRGFKKHAHYINIKHTNTIPKLVPSVMLSLKKRQ